MSLLYCDRYDAAERHHRAAMEDARRSGSVLGFALCSSFRALAGYRRGLLLEAEADARAAIDAFAGADRSLLAFVEAVLAETLIQRGALDAGEAALGSIPPVAAAEGEWYLVWAAHARARLRLAQGRLPEALEEVLACGRTSRASSMPRATILDWRSSAALIHLARGERAPARSLVDEELEIARAFGAPRAVGVALYASGLVEGGDRGIALLQEAELMFAGCGARLDQARALAARGAAPRRANRRADAREPLRSALDLAHRCGARTLERQAHVELKATGARPQRAVRTGVDALTPSELRVARLAADGSSNRAIAQALFVTPKTVETHLGHAYAKLGVSSRGDLSRSLASA